VREWESFYETHPNPTVAAIYRRWKRNRALFDETEGMAVGRDTELALREKTDHARGRLDEAEDAWAAAGFPYRGRHVRRWDKRRLDFFKALSKENLEYEGTLLYRGLDPENDSEIDAFLADYRADG
jgi:hypothetical protein